eukprot:scaffold12244_cov216-Isochrysis_galbana.AAC.16
MTSPPSRASPPRYLPARLALLSSTHYSRGAVYYNSRAVLAVLADSHRALLPCFTPRSHHGCTAPLPFGNQMCACVLCPSGLPLRH